ncbi:MAG: hypothetical protein ACI3Y5_09070 [Prevotella sp.]
MDNRIYRHASTISLLFILLAFAGCNRNKETEDKMNMADSLMTSRPDSALAILSKIDTTLLSSRELRARYALLKSMALDKNYIDTTSFIILKPAIDYYLKHGTPDEQLRTYYYQGRIYQNRGEDNDAMQSFMNGSDLKEKVTDSLLLAHTLVAEGFMYFKQYKTDEFIQKNLEAAKIYIALSQDFLGVKSYLKALDGFIITNNKAAADSILKKTILLAHNNPDSEEYLFSSFLSYTIEFGTTEETKRFLDKYQDMELKKNDVINFAQGYSKIGEHDKALIFLSKKMKYDSILDTLKFLSVKTCILENKGNYKEALSIYKEFSSVLGRHQKKLQSQGLLFSDEKHQLEMDNLLNIQERDRIILIAICCLFTLVMLAGWLYYQGHIKSLETLNLKLEISQLESERDKLKELQQNSSELAKPVKDIINMRLDMLNSLLAKEITNNERYAKPYNNWIEDIQKDKKSFMDSTRLAFIALHPKLMEYLEKHGLTTDEMNHLCLYAIGLRGKDVGEYTQTKRHYIISHEIRKKLGIDEHETNIGLYIRKLIKEEEW